MVITVTISLQKEVEHLKKNKAVLGIFLAPALLIFIMIFLYPIIRTLIMSFFYIDGVTAEANTWQFVGIENYLKLFNTTLFRESMWNLFRIWFFGALIVMPIALLFATILTSGIRFKKFFRAVIYLPNIVSAVALATMWLQAVYSSKFGLWKRFFELLGMEKLAKFQWLNADHKFMALLIAYCFGMVGYNMLIFISGIERISPEYYEAATLDGANKIKQFRYITLPLLKDVTRTCLTMWSVSAIGFFTWSQLFSSVGMDKSTVTPTVYMYAQIFGAASSGVTERNAGLGAAIGVVLCIATVLIFWILNKTLKNTDVEF